MDNVIFETLRDLGMTSMSTRKMFSHGTRDNPGVNVWRDSVTGVIYISDFYTGDEAYASGKYRQEKVDKLSTGKPDLERSRDLERRVNTYSHLCVGKNIAEFGCGSGDFLNKMKMLCENVVGIELQTDYISKIRNDGISCVSNIDSLPPKSLDVLLAFHVYEHLPNPIDTLMGWVKKVKLGGKIVIEVPHANDLLLQPGVCDSFKKFTLWSQHLILHRRQSLFRMMNHVGCNNIQIEGVQRYPVSNHLHWLSAGTPGGHKASMSIIDSRELNAAYAASLGRIDATDTLVAIADVS
ncbi:class I SAM-dependent methyltransferase [Alphaproteobacteria bacterium]|nr:class I SAM-dependent methyltransferase [Alphaproteobacteria bacterium]